MRWLFPGKICLFLACLIWAPPALPASPLAVKNETSQDIINLLVSPAAGGEFFIRLDLAPGAEASVENPGATVALRADTGLEFWFFDSVPLNEAKSLAFCNGHDIRLTGADGGSEHIAGRALSLVDAAEPVCELTRFRPGMRMSEVCRILPQATPRDDNGAYLASLGFGGLVWAARLAPGRAGGDDPMLEHLELRRRFSRQDLEATLAYLLAQGYVPWQTELPRAELDFADMPDKSAADRQEALRDVLAEYLDACARASCPDGTVMLAPANSLDALANADAPSEDVQLFTLNLMPAKQALLLDVAAYRAGEKNQD